MSGQELRLRVNGRAVGVARTPDRPLLVVLRDELRLTGTKYGCGEGECGSCTVLVDGLPVHSCQVPVSEVAGKGVTTVEGLGADGRLNPVQRAFAEVGAFQCGYCTPGMVVRATALLQTHPSPTRDEILTSMEGNVCRCCGYPRIVRAVERAVELAREEADRR